MFAYRPLTLLVLAAFAAVRPASGAQEKKPATKPVTLGSLTGQAPANWESQPAGGQFRLAQFAVPKTPGDTAQALFIVFHFGAGGGGGVEDNVKRWYGMMRQPDGSDSAKAAKRQLSQRDGLKITTVDLAGTYQERPFPASPQVTERPGYRMLAAIVETTKEGGDGPYFLRLVGPAKSIEAARPGWESLLGSLKDR